MVKVLVHLLVCTGAASIAVQSSVEAFWSFLYLVTLLEAVQCQNVPNF